MKSIGIWSRAVAVLALLAMIVGGWKQAAAQEQAQADSRFFPETNHTVRGAFLRYWNNNGGLAQQGYPITDEYPEVNVVDGKSYTTQYFQRSRFEYHPEQTDPNNQVLLGLLGYEALIARYPSGSSGAPAVNVPGSGPSQFFAQTGRTVSGLFLQYWQTHGGVRQQGYPISDAFVEASLTDGQSYITQYFERARFEYHPETPSTPVLLGLVGNEIYQRKQGGGNPNPPNPPSGNPTPNPSGTCTTAVYQIFQYATTTNNLLATLGCPTSAGEDYNTNRVFAGHQVFRYGEGLILSKGEQINYVYGLYANRDGGKTFKRIGYTGTSVRGGDPPTPGPHFYNYTESLNLGEATDEEDWGDGAYQTFQNGMLIYVGSQTQMVYALYPAAAAQGTWDKYKSRENQ